MAETENDFGYEFLPKLDAADNFSWGYIFDRMYAGQMEGMISFGMNPVANGPNTRKMLGALAKLKWLIVAECFETETASFWKAKELAEKYYPTAPDPSTINTEVFLLPAACFAEKDGAFVNSSRWAQWKNTALDPPGQALRDQDIIARLFLRIRELYEQEGGAAPGPLLNMAWNWQNRLSPSLSEVAREINGRDASGRQIAGFRCSDGRRIDCVRQLDLCRLIHGSRQHDGAPRPGGSDGARPVSQLGMELARQSAHPLQPCFRRRNR